MACVRATWGKEVPKVTKTLRLSAYSVQQLLPQAKPVGHTPAAGGQGVDTRDHLPPPARHDCIAPARRSSGLGGRSEAQLVFRLGPRPGPNIQQPHRLRPQSQVVRRVLTRPVRRGELQSKRLRQHLAQPPSEIKRQKQSSLREAF